MEKIQRNQMAHFLQVGDEYIRLGRDLEEYQPKIKARVEKSTDILGRTSVHILGYEKQGTVAPYYARQGDPLFEMLQSILDGGLLPQDCQVFLVEAKLWLTQDGVCPAIREECFLEVTSYGGDTSGYQVNFNIHYTGNRTCGTFDPEAGTFTPS